MAGRRADEEKKAAFAAGETWRARGENTVCGRARTSAATALLVAMLSVVGEEGRGGYGARRCRYVYVKSAID